MTEALIRPDDEANRQLLAAVHPPDWKNPTPVGKYNLVVLGADDARKQRVGRVGQPPGPSPGLSELVEEGPTEDFCARPVLDRLGQTGDSEFGD